MKDGHTPIEDHTLASYLIETPHPIERALDKMLSLQSTGTFTDVPGETDELKRRFAIGVTRITPLDPVDRPSLPSWNYRTPVTETTRFNRAEVELSIPLALTETVYSQKTSQTRCFTRNGIVRLYQGIHIALKPLTGLVQVNIGRNANLTWLGIRPTTSKLEYQSALVPGSGSLSAFANN